MSNLNNSQKILIIGPAWVGDMVMAQALFKLLKQRNPAVIIDVLAPEWTRALLERMPEVNQALVLPFNHGQTRLWARYQMGRRLRVAAYDQAIVLPNSFKSAILSFGARIARRTGWCGEMRWGLLNDVRYLDKAKLPLMIQRFAALGIAKDEVLPTELPWPSLQVSTASVTASLATLSMMRPTKPVLALCPGAEFGPAKRWPATYYAQVAQAKIQQGWEVWIFGSHKDVEIAEEIEQILAATSNSSNNSWQNLTSKTTLAQAIDLLSLATAVVTNDSGLMHIAAALDKPMVAIYGSSSPNFTPPLTKNVKVLTLNLICSPCFKRECPLGHLQCLRDLSSEQVLTALTSVVAA